MTPSDECKSDEIRKPLEDLYADLCESCDMAFVEFTHVMSCSTEIQCYSSTSQYMLEF